MIIILEIRSAFLLAKGRLITGTYLEFDQIEEIVDVFALPNYITKTFPAVLKISPLDDSNRGQASL